MGNISQGEIVNMNIFSKLKSLMKGNSYLIDRDILSKYINESIKLSNDFSLSAVDEFFVSAAEGEQEEHIVITNNDIPCDNKLKSEEGLSGITIYVNRTPYYDPEKDDIYTDINELISDKLGDFPDRFILRHEGNIVSLKEYQIYKERR